jgi:ER lumen protein retaining receptor
MGLFSICGRNKAISNNLEELVIYVLFGTVCCLMGKFFTNHMFSALITLASAVQLLGFYVLRIQMRKRNGASAVSVTTLKIYVVAYVCRLFSTTQFDGYLPIDRSGDGLYQCLDIAALLLVCSMVVRIWTTYKSSYEWDGWRVIPFVAVCLVLSVFVHPGLNHRLVPDIAWAMGLYLESVAMVPQLFLLQSRGGEVGSEIGHYIACMFVSRVWTLRFWYSSYEELAPSAGHNAPGYGVIGAQVLQVLIFGDFMWLYIKSHVRQTKLVLPPALNRV